MILKCITFLFAVVALAGCCASGNGCYAPLPGSPIAWDGFDSAPAENGNDSKPMRNLPRDHEIIIGPLNEAAAQSEPKSQSSDRWAREQAADRDADAKLTKQLMICRNC